MKAGDWRENPKRRDPKRRPLPEILKERNIKKEGGGGSNSRTPR